MSTPTPNALLTNPEQSDEAASEAVVEFGVELLDLKTPAAVREVRDRMSRFDDSLSQLADQLEVLQNDQLRQAVSDPTTKLGKMLAEHEISVAIADGPNSALLRSPLLLDLDQEGCDTLLLPPGAEISDILSYVREAIPQRAVNRSATQAVWAESAAPNRPAEGVEQTRVEDELAAYLAENNLRLIRETDRSHIDIGRLGNDMCILVPADTAPEVVLDCAHKHVVGSGPAVKHGRTWTYIDRRDGTQRTVTCPAFCRNDHSADILSPSYTEDIFHQDCAVGVYIPLTDTHEPPTSWRVLEPQLAVSPGSDSAENKPHVSVEVVEGVWSGPLGPEELADFIEAMSGGLDGLRDMQIKLVAALGG